MAWIFTYFIFSDNIRYNNETPLVFSKNKSIIIGTWYILQYNDRLTQHFVSQLQWMTQEKQFAAFKITPPLFSLTGSYDLLPFFKACGSPCDEVWVWASIVVWSGVFTRTCGSVGWLLVRSVALCCVLLCQFVSVCVCVSSVRLCLCTLTLELHLLHRSLMSRSPCTRHLTNSAERVSELSWKLDTQKIMWSDWGL